MKKVLLICILLAAAGCRVDGSGPDFSPSPSPSPRPSNLTGLRSFEDCDTLQEHLQSLNDLSSAPLVEEMAPLPDGSIEADADGAGADIAVVEGDIIRHVGNRLYIANTKAGVLIYDTSMPAFPKLLGQIVTDDSPWELQVDGMRVAVISTYFDGPSARYWTTVTVFDVTDPSEPVMISQSNYEGQYTSSRLVGHVLYLALRGLAPSDDVNETKTRFATCQDVYVPLQMEENQTAPSHVWTLIGLEMQDDEQDAARVSIVGSWHSNILASPEHFYLANYMDQPAETSIYLFKISAQQASIQPWSQADVPGSIVNHRAMDESDGVFRIASTANQWAMGDQRNYVTTFDVTQDDFELLDQIDTITPGERITAARFTPDYLFLTTFVTFDPLVVVDLRNPLQLSVRGELEVPGIGNQLEVWGDRIISIGRNQAGCGEVMLTLFDISDLDAPQLIDQVTLSNAINSTALWDHRAYTFHPDFELLALPLAISGQAAEMGFIHVDPEKGFTDLGGVNHGQLLDDEERLVLMQRSLRVVNHHYSISEAGISVSSFFDLTDPVSEVAYPGLEAEDYIPISEIPLLDDMCIVVFAE